MPIPNLKLTADIGGKKITFVNGPNFSGQYSEHYQEPKLISCSLYSVILNDGINNIVVDERAIGLGDKALIILKALPFWQLLDDALMNDDLWYSRNFVTYYDPKNHNGDLSLHHKDVALDFHKEYRILKRAPDDRPKKVYLPGLKEISIVADSKDLLSFKATINPS